MGVYLSGTGLDVLLFAVSLKGLACSFQLQCPLIMGKHLTDQELDVIRERRKDAPKEVHKRLANARRRCRKAGPSLSTVRRALKGLTHKRAAVETRGRKRILSNANLQALERTRKRLIEKADDQYEVHWEDVVQSPTG